MDFMNRNNQPQGFSAAPQTSGPVSAQPVSGKKDKQSNKRGPAWLRWATWALLVVGVLLVASLVALIATSKPESQAKYVSKDKLQAIFLNTGQVYFGNIRSINSQYFVLGNIYYLQSNNTTDSKNAAANNNISLVKLGCELHEPYDQMIINRDQVTFWENLQDGGQVAKAVKEFATKNPNGQQCSTQGAAAAPTTNVQGNTSTNTNTTPTTKP